MKLTDKGGSDFQTVEAGVYMARCYKIIDLGTQQGEYEGKSISKRELVIGWEFPTELMEDGKPFVTSAFYTASIGEKAKLRKLLIDWRGRDFTPEELQGFEIKNLLGAPCQLNMVANKKGKVVVGSASPLMKGTKCADQMNDSVYMSLEHDEFDQKVFDGLGDFFQKKIMASPEWLALKGGKVTEYDVPEPPAPDNGDDMGDLPF